MAKNYYETIYLDNVETLCVNQDVPITDDNRDYEFEKFFAAELLHRLQKADVKCMQVKSLTRVLSIITALIELKDNRNNIIYASVTEIARELHVSRNTAYRYLQTFDELGLITNIGNSRWQLDPAVFAHMKPGQRRNILIRYRAVKAKKEADKNQRKLFDEQEQELQELLEAVNA